MKDYSPNTIIKFIGCLNAIKEFHKERLELNPAGGKISEIERSIITKYEQGGENN